MSAPASEGAAPPLHFLLDDPGIAFRRNPGGESDAIARTIAGDGAHGAHAAQAVRYSTTSVLASLPRGGDAGRRAGRAAADDHHVVAAQHGQARASWRIVGNFLDRPHARRAFLARRPRLAGRGRLAENRGSLGICNALGLCGRGRADPRAEIDQGQRPRSASPPGSRLTSAQPPSTYSRRMPPDGTHQAGNLSVPDHGPAAVPRPLHGVGRDLKQLVGGKLLFGLIRHLPGRCSRVCPGCIYRPFIGSVKVYSINRVDTAV